MLNVRARLLQAFEDHALQSPGQPALVDGRGGVQTWGQLLEARQSLEQELASRPAGKPSNRWAVYGDEQEWLGAWWAALRAGVAWMPISDHLATGLCHLLEVSWSATDRLFCSQEKPLAEAQPLPESTLYATGEAPSLALQWVTEHQWEHRTPTWEAWWAGAPGQTVGWWLPLQHRDSVEVGLRYLEQGSTLVRPDPSLRSNVFMAWHWEKSKPLRSTKGLDRIHLTALQAMETDWNSAALSLRAWVHGPCPDWVLSLHPGLSRAPEKGRPGRIEPAPLSAKDSDLWEHFACLEVERDEKAWARTHVEAWAQEVPGVAHAVWYPYFDGSGRCLLMFVAPGFSSAWVGAQVQRHLRQRTDAVTQWKLVPWHLLDVTEKAQPDLLSLQRFMEG